MVHSALAGLIPLIRRTGIAVAVAGIDDDAQADWWRGAGADSARGAVFAPAVAGQAVPALLRGDPT
jgi:EAL domain-containing protein (putative c-di-GMP-specific phosphodiesterase class I)